MRPMMCGCYFHPASQSLESQKAGKPGKPVQWKARKPGKPTLGLRRGKAHSANAS